MKKLLLALAALLALAGPVAAANVNIDGLPAAGSVGGTDLLECEQGGTNRKCTAAQTAAYVYGLMSADATAAAGGALTLATVNGNVGSFGSATNCVTLTVNAKGLITAASQATCTPAIGSVSGLGAGVATFLATPSSANLATALTDETGTGAAVFGTSPTFTTGVTFGFVTGGGNQCLHVNNAGSITGTGADCGAGGGGVTSIAGNTGAFTLNATSGITNSTNDIVCSQGSSSQFGCVKADNTTITAASGVLSAAPSTATPEVQTGTNYAFQSTDRTKVKYLSNGSNQTPTIAQAGTGGFTTGWYTTACNIAAGTQTITTTTSTIAGIAGATGYVLPAGSVAAPICIGLISDGTNWVIVPDYFRFGTGAATAAGAAVNTNGGLLTASTAAIASNALVTGAGSGTALTGTTPGTGVLTALGTNLSAAGGLSTTVASGTSALGTSSISSAACASAVTTSATNTATTDVIWWGFNGDPTAVTGYVPLVAGMLTIIAYPSANNVNFKVCNNTNGSITPGAITLNWRVIR